MRNMNMSDAVVNYAAHLQAKGLAPNTIKNCTQTLHRAIKIWGDIFVRSVKPVHIDRLFADGNWSPSTRNLYLGTLRQFFKWARHEGVMNRDFDPTFGWRNAKVVRSDKMRLPVEQFGALLEACEHPRDRASVAVGLMLMLRGGEIQTLRVNDLDLGDRTMSIYRHKTKEYDVMPVDEVLRIEMVRWLNWYREDQGNLVGSWYLIPSKMPNEWTWDKETHKLYRVDKLASLRPEQIMSHPYRPAQRALSGLGYETKGEGEHTLRRSAARAYADRLRSEGTDGALMKVASWLGHSDIRVTQEYIGWNMEKENRNESVKHTPLFPAMLQEHKSGLRLVGDGHSG